MKLERWLGALVVALGILATGCSGGEEDMQKGLVKVSAPSKSQVEAVANMRVVFGHQSVGGEILKGVAAIAAKEGVSLSIEEARAVDPGKRGLLHFKVGQNEQPKSKITDYVAALSSSGFEGVDAALMKLCYIDFKTDTDAKQLANEYSAAIDLLQSKYPQTRFIAVTAPLTTIQTGPKAWLKRLMGKYPAGYEINAVRQQFNDELRARFAPDKLFDIAKIEALSGDKPHIFSFKERDNVEALDPAFTYDGGHLNELGQQRVAAALINLLAAR